ncbi:hypothetical protein HZH68_009911 [Vespula germanica]|uniref:Uncharacterized protein n=1 Tax=Vespula germanica TaxID=30212 RepID=A0A834JYB0_VESGE|nr:hypothetical protein HZH68_009911 [Vespula germanica]
MSRMVGRGERRRDRGRGRATKISTGGDGDDGGGGGGGGGGGDGDGGGGGGGGGGDGGGGGGEDWTLEDQTKDGSKIASRNFIKVINPLRTFKAHFVASKRSSSDITKEFFGKSLAKKNPMDE